MSAAETESRYYPALEPRGSERLVDMLTNYGDASHITRSDLAHTFGELVKIAAPKMRSHQGDLFHDAHQLAEYASREENPQRLSLVFVVGELHTYLFERDNAEWCAMAEQFSEHNDLYSVELSTGAPARAARKTLIIRRLRGSQ